MKINANLVKRKKKTKSTKPRQFILRKSRNAKYLKETLISNHSLLGYAAAMHSKKCKNLSEKWWKIINFPTQNHLKHSYIQQVPPGTFPLQQPVSHHSEPLKRESQSAATALWEQGEDAFTFPHLLSGKQSHARGLCRRPFPSNQPD